MSDEDPEVVADLRLRAATERDPNRSREMPRYEPAKIHSHVPCRGRCGAIVSWTEEAEHAFQTWNRVLAAKAEAPLDKTRIVFCNTCRQRGAELTADANRKKVDAMAAAIRELKIGCHEHRENELLDKLEQAGHPDVPGLRQWLRDNAGKSKRQTKGAY